MSLFVCIYIALLAGHTRDGGGTIFADGKYVPILHYYYRTLEEGGILGKGETGHAGYQFWRWERYKVWLVKGANERKDWIGVGGCPRG
jgi:hypothetical protein